MSKIQGERFAALVKAARAGLELLEIETDRDEDLVEHEIGDCRGCDSQRLLVQQRRHEIQLAWEALFLLNDRYGRRAAGRHK